MKADDIDAAISAISDRLNLVGPGANVDTVRRMNQLISDWQDFYWSEFEQWPVNQLSVWETNIPNMEASVVQLEQTAGRVSAPVTSAPTGPVVNLPELRVVGTWPTWMKVSAASVLTIALYKVARKLKIL